VNAGRSDVSARLRDAAVPDEAAARERGWQLVAKAYDEREPLRRGRRGARAGRLAAMLVAAGLAVALVAVTPPGAAVGDWLRDVVRPEPAPAPVTRPVLGPLPGHGRLLVLGPSGPWIVQPDGARRRLGAYDDAAFSPRGLFVAVTRGRMLAAVDPRGGLRWSLTRPAPVTRPAWSPDGFRIAYRAGGSLRVVYGDGARDRTLAAHASPVTPAWRPGPAHLVAFAAGSAVALRDADRGGERWRARLPGPARALAWAPDGRRLLAVTPGAVTVLDRRGGVLRTVELPAARAVAWLPSGRAFAALRAGATSEVMLVGARDAAPRRLLAVPGRLRDLAASPDGRWLLASAPDADQWLLVRTSGGGRIAARSDVARQFDPGARGPGRSPRILGWVR
jgi:hypothetical protein